ncbi:MAG TPA: hypothetical protein VGA63_13820 [Geopsychrobacteraceae bacterium]
MFEEHGDRAGRPISPGAQRQEALLARRMKQTLLFILKLCGAALLGLAAAPALCAAEESGASPAVSVSHPGFNTPPAKNVSREDYLSEAEIVFTSHLCPHLRDLQDPKGGRVLRGRAAPPVTQRCC